jgi:hypothetical protein
VRTRAKIQLTVPLPTLLDLSRQPAELGGYGPILLETARRILANHLDNPDALFTVGVTHPITGRLLSLHPVPRRFLRGLGAELVEALNQRCVWTTCRRPANTCHLDHTTDHAVGGETSAANNGPLCPGHHTVKTEGQWTMHQPMPGHFTFTDPHGRVYQTGPPRLTDPDGTPFPQTARTGSARTGSARTGSARTGSAAILRARADGSQPGHSSGPARR